MAAISELIRKEDNGSISFGDYTLDSKAKLDNFEFNGDIYKVKTFKEITKLERNGVFVYETETLKPSNLIGFIPCLTNSSASSLKQSLTFSLNTFVASTDNGLSTYTSKF